MSRDELAFGEVELSDGCRVVITKTPGICESVITLSVQRLYGKRYDTEQEIVLGATAAQCMADIVTAFVRGTKRTAAREPQATKPCHICHNDPAGYPFCSAGHAPPPGYVEPQAIRDPSGRVRSATAQWRAWAKAAGGDEWDKIEDIERELGRGEEPAIPAALPTEETKR